MSGNIRVRGNIYHYDFEIDGKRYRGSCKTSDKNLAEHIAETIKADILRTRHDLPSTINYLFKEIWEEYYEKLNEEDRGLLRIRKVAFIAPED